MGTSIDGIEISWKYWSEATDYGTGPVNFYYVHYWSEGIDNKQKASSSPASINDIVRGVYYTYWVSAVREIGGIEYEGSPGPDITVLVGCGGKNFIKNKENGFST